MFIACGVGAYSAGVFHLFTHAYFKALLFLGCGSIILGMHHEQEVKYMGGLRKYMPITYWTFLLASLSISGVPGFAGFFSKDEILAMAFASPVGAGKFAWFIGTLVAGMTAFYSFRLFLLIFHGEFRGTDKQKAHLKESPKVVTVPLLLLAVGAVAAGNFGIPAVLGGKANWGHYMEPVLGHALGHPSHATELILMIISVSAGAFGIFLAWKMYMKKPEMPKTIADRFPVLYKLSLNKYYVDEIYDFLIVKPTLFLSRTVILNFFDIGIIDKIINGVPKLIGQLSGSMRKMQDGLVSHYLAYMCGGAVFIIIWMVVGA
jgi:NADH-quinone oxidoreductase subunit L